MTETASKPKAPTFPEHYSRQEVANIVYTTYTALLSAYLTELKQPSKHRETLFELGRSLKNLQDTLQKKLGSERVLGLAVADVVKDAEEARKITFQLHAEVKHLEEAVGEREARIKAVREKAKAHPDEASQQELKNAEKAYFSLRGVWIFHINLLDAINKLFARRKRVPLKPQA